MTPQDSATTPALETHPGAREMATCLDAAGGIRGMLWKVDCHLSFGNADKELTALQEGAGIVDLGSRTRIELRGDDRAKFLHNLCTNDVRKLAPGQGCETFLCNAQGKILFHVLVYCLNDSLLIDTSPGERERLLAHLDRYLIREKVELRDRSADLAEFLVAGQRAKQLVPLIYGETKQPLELPDMPLANLDVPVKGAVLHVARTPFLSDEAYLVFCPWELAVAVWQRLVDGGCTPCGCHAFDAARIAAGFPLLGQDITIDNLPQEVARDDRTISFVKGCYLGQETVARIDALGHVNRMLCGLRVQASAQKAIGEDLSSEGKVVGKLTSVSTLRSKDGYAALGYVRRGLHAPGAILTSSFQQFHVVALPSRGA